MDVLSDVLRAVRLTGAIYFDMSFRPPFVGESPPMSAIAGSVMPEAEHVISFHMLLAGSCFAEIVGADLPPVRLEAGDVVIFPMGDANVMTSTPGLRDTPDLRELLPPARPPAPLRPEPRPARRRGRGPLRLRLSSAATRGRSTRCSAPCPACCTAPAARTAAAGSPR